MTPQEYFSGWMNEHYDVIGDGVVCKRCGDRVSYLTKHAAVRHGDAIEVMPAVNGNTALTEAY